MFRRSGRTHW